ncbi:hypothetical protein [Demequina salsinemoris]|uniref:hypothetical protein n=1 Tax=Demequina salsinemoris TaxID=577470 RepID=UPI0007820150|nr:hypothetical protein [Demequina salsinemoris]
MDNGGEVTQLRRIVGVGEAAYVAAGARAEVVRALAVPELRAPDKVLMQGEAVVALMPLTEGATLGDVIRATGPLSAGGCVWVGTRVARALARLHRAGMAHGAVEADNVVIELGHAVLLDTGSGVTSATQSDDVAALGRLLRVSVRDGDADVMTAWTNPMSAADPAARPTAAMVARALPGAAQERPVALPGPSVASRMRDSVGGVGRDDVMGPGAAGAPARSVERDVRAPAAAARRGPGARRDPRSDHAGAPSAPPSGPWARLAGSLETTPRRLAGLTGLAGAAVVASGAAVWLLMGAGAATAEDASAAAGAASSATAVPSASLDVGQSSAAKGAAEEVEEARAQAVDDGQATMEDPADAASTLTEQRFAALADGDAAALIATTAPGSTARARAEDQAAAVEAGGLAYEGLSVRVESAEVGDADEDSATVVLTYIASPHTVVIDGERSDVEAARETVELTMEAIEGNWLVSSVSER